MRIRMGVLIAVSTVYVAVVHAQTPEHVAQKVAAVAEYQRGDSREPLIEIETLIRESHGETEVRAAITDALARLLGSEATQEAKLFAGRQLWLIGPETALPVLGPMLLDDETADMACFAIALDPSPKAGETLRNALANADGNAEIAIVNLLGDRRDTDAVSALCAISGGDKLPAACAAVRALGKIGAEAAAACLAMRLESDEATVRSAAMDASLICAEQLLKSGKRAGAAAIYTELTKETYPETVRRAAELGLNHAKLGPPIVLFDGSNLDHWEGNMDMWRIEDGALVGGSLEHPIPHNDFLCTKEVFGDFELRLRVKVSSPDTNGGIQIRSQRVPDDHEVSGYQADMGETYWGCLYDETRRNRMLATVDQEKLAAFMDVHDWNDYVIRCEGNRIRLWLNGFQTVDYTETDDEIPQSGIIGIQIHSGPPRQAYYKDIMLREILPIE